MSDESKRKISEANKGKKSFLGKKHSMATRKRMRESHKGVKGWHLSNETKRKMSEWQKGDKSPMYGKKHTEKTKRKMSEAHKGIKNHNYGKSFSEESKKKARESRIKFMISGKIKKHDTDIERLFEDELIRRNIPYTKQVPLLKTTIVDFLLLNDIVIYVDGDYWHSLSKTKIKDIDKSFILTFHGYKVFRFKGSEIKKSVKKCIDKVMKYNEKT